MLGARNRLLGYPCPPPSQTGLPWLRHASTPMPSRLQGVEAEVEVSLCREQSLTLRLLPTPPPSHA